VNPGEPADISEILALCLDSGQPSRWEDFIERAHGIVAPAVIRALGGAGVTTAQDADDVIQDVFLKLCGDQFRALRSFRAAHPAALPAYLRAVAASAAIDHIRMRRAGKRGGGREHEDLDKAELTVKSGDDPARTVERSLLIERIGKCLDPHETRDRQIFWMYYRHGFSASAIARLPRVALSIKGVESAIHRLTKSVRDCLALGRPAGTSPEGTGGRIPS